MKSKESMKNELMNAPQIKPISTDDKKAYRSLISGIEKEISKVEKSYLEIAKKIYLIHSKELFQVDGYKNIYELSKDKFSLARGTTNNYINIITRFGARDEFTGEFTGNLRDEFLSYSSSKLIVMLGFSDSQLASCTPDMSVRQLKELRREFADSESLIESSDEAEPDNEEEPIIDVEAEELTEIEKKSKSVLIAEVDDIFNLSDEVKESILDASEDFRKSMKGKKVRFRISIVW